LSGEKYDIVEPMIEGAAALLDKEGFEMLRISILVHYAVINLHEGHLKFLRKSTRKISSFYYAN
jgi:hypothetical protein